MHSNLFNKLSFLSLFLSIILLPLFFLPFTSIPIETSKGLLLVIGLALSVIFWGFARFFDGEIVLPKSLCLLGGAGVVLAFFLSAIFSQSSQVSLFGTMFDVGTFWFLFVGFLLMLMSSIVFRELKNAKMVLFGTIISGALILIFQAVHLFLPQVLSLGILTDKTSNVLGSWNTFGIFAGFLGLVSLLIVEFFPISKKEKFILKILTVFSVLLVAIVNFPFVWQILGVFALIIFVYRISITSKQNQSDGGKAHFPVFSFSIMMLAFLFFISGQFVGGIISSRLELSNNEVSPSLVATMSVTKSVLNESPVFGTGPNKFAEAWAMHKPEVVNTTDFWNVAFNSGSGLIPTLVSTTGIVGILTWFIFFVLFIIAGVRSVFSSMKEGTNWETMAFFILSFYLFISSFFYSTGPVIFLLALAFAGIFIGLATSNQTKSEISLSFLNDHRKSFFSMLFLVLIIIISVGLSFKYVEKFSSVIYFKRTLAAETVPEALKSINKALALHENDLYLRTYAQVYLAKLNSLVTKGDSLSDADKADLQISLDQIISSSQKAIAYNPSNYLNFQSLGSVYQIAASLGIKDAYEKAIESYETALTLNLNNPGIKLAMASAATENGKNKEAKEYANSALSIKPNYIDALIVLSQIAKSEGSNAEALSYAQRALSVSPTDVDLIKYVDSLKSSKSSSEVTSEDSSTEKKQ